MLAVVDVHDRVEVCGEVPKVTLVGDNVHVSPAGVEADTVNETVPVNPPTEVRVIVEVPEAPASIWAGLTAPAEIVKSAPAATETVTVLVSVPLVPVTVTLKLWAVEHPAVRVAVLGVGSVTLVGEMVAVQPLGTVEVTARPMVPVKPLTALAVIVDVPVPPGV